MMYKFNKVSDLCSLGAEMTMYAEQLNYDREVIRVWFCNKRQGLKNTIKKLKVQENQLLTGLTHGLDGSTSVSSTTTLG